MKGPYFRPVSFAGTFAGALCGLVATLLMMYVFTFTLSLFNSVNYLPPAGITALLGVLLGAAVPAIASGTTRARIAVAAMGLLAGAVWNATISVTTGGLPLVFTLGSLAAFATAALYTASAFRGMNPAKMRKDNGETLLVRMLKGLLLSGMTIMVAFPFLFMLSLSLRSRAEYLSDPTNLSVNLLQPISQLFNGYVQVLTRFSFGLYIVNSTVIALLTVLVTLVTGILGAYAVTRLKFPGRRFMSKAILLIYMFPAIVLVIPLYTVFTQLGLRNTRHGLLIVYSAMTIPVALYMLRSYFQTLPAELEEAGLIDGCSRGGVIWRITIPLSGPAIASVGLYVFMIAWNEFLFAFMFLDTPAIFTLSRGMVVLDDMEVPRQFLMAGASIITIPIMFLFFRFQRYLVGGLTAGSVKG